METKLKLKIESDNLNEVLDLVKSKENEGWIKDSINKKDNVYIAEIHLIIKD